MFKLKWEISWHKLRATCQTAGNKQPAKQRRDDETAMLGTRHVPPSLILVQFHMLLPSLGAKSGLCSTWLGWGEGHTVKSTPWHRKRYSWEPGQLLALGKEWIRAVLNTLNRVDQILSPSNAVREFSRTAHHFEHLLNNPAYRVHTRLPGCNSKHRACISPLSTRMRCPIPQALQVHFPSTILRNQCCRVLQRNPSERKTAISPSSLLASLERRSRRTYLSFHLWI